MPGTIHATVQNNLQVELTIRYRRQYTILPDLGLDTGEAHRSTPRFDDVQGRDVIEQTGIELPRSAVFGA